MGVAAKVVESGYGVAELLPRCERLMQYLAAHLPQITSSAFSIQTPTCLFACARLRSFARLRQQRHHPQYAKNAYGKQKCRQTKGVARYRLFLRSNGVLGRFDKQHAHYYCADRHQTAAKASYPTSENRARQRKLKHHGKQIVDKVYYHASPHTSAALN